MAFHAARVDMLKMLPTYVQGCFSNEIETQTESCLRIRKLLSMEENPPIAEVIETGIVPKLVEFLQNKKSNKLVFEALWALTNIASGDAEHTAVVIRDGAISHITNLILSPYVDISEQAIWALGNIAGDSPQCRTIVLQAGILPNLINLQTKILYNLNQINQKREQTNNKQKHKHKHKHSKRKNNTKNKKKNDKNDKNANKDNVHNGDSSDSSDSSACSDNSNEKSNDNSNDLEVNRAHLKVLGRITWTVNNLCSGKPLPSINYIQPIISSLNGVLSFVLKHRTGWDDIDIIMDACWAFSYITEEIGNVNNENSNQLFEILVANDVFDQLFACLTMNINDISDIEYEYERDLVAKKVFNVKLGSLRSFANIVAGSDEHTQYIIDTVGVLDGLVSFLNVQYAKLDTKYETTVVKETCWMISNITAGTREQVLKVINGNIVPMLVSLYFANDGDFRLDVSVKKEIAWAVCNATSMGDIVPYFVECDVIRLFADILGCKEILDSNSLRPLTVAMEAMENIFKCGEKLRKAKNNKHKNKNKSGKNKNKNKYVKIFESHDGFIKLRSIEQDYENMTENVVEYAEKLIDEYWSDMPKNAGVKDPSNEDSKDDNGNIGLFGSVNDDSNVQDLANSVAGWSF